MYFLMFECVQAARVMDMPFVLCKLCRCAVSVHCTEQKGQNSSYVKDLNKLDVTSLNLPFPLLLRPITYKKC
jgi:hypothetical protein